MLPDTHFVKEASASLTASFSASLILTLLKEAGKEPEASLTKIKEAEGSLTKIKKADLEEAEPSLRNLVRLFFLRRLKPL